MVVEEVRDEVQPPTQFYMEQPEDPARYQSPQDVQEHQYFSAFKTQEWKSFAERYGIYLLHFDQFPMGHVKRKTDLTGNQCALDAAAGWDSRCSTK